MVAAAATPGALAQDTQIQVIIDRLNGIERDVSVGGGFGLSGLGERLAAFTRMLPLAGAALLVALLIAGIGAVMWVPQAVLQDLPVRDVHWGRGGRRSCQLRTLDRRALHDSDLRGRYGLGQPGGRQCWISAQHHQGGDGTEKRQKSEGVGDAGPAWLPPSVMTKRDSAWLSSISTTSSA